MSSEIKSIKRRKNSYQKPRANNYATRVTEDNHKKQNERKKQSHYRNGKEHYKQNTGKKMMIENQERPE